MSKMSKTFLVIHFLLFFIYILKVRYVILIRVKKNFVSLKIIKEYFKKFDIKYKKCNIAYK